MILIVLIVFTIGAVHSLSGNLTTATNFQIREHRSRDRRLLKNPCIILMYDTDFSSNNSTKQLVECELQGIDRGGKNYAWTFVRLDLASLSDMDSFQSGITTLFASNAEIDDDVNELIIPKGEKIKFSKVHSRSTIPRNTDDTIVRRLLVLRVVAKDRATSATESELSNKIFGIDGVTMTLRSQFALCSDGKLKFEPISTIPLIGDDGVYTVKLPKVVAKGANDRRFAGAVIEQASRDLNITELAPNLADHILVCLPPGAGEGIWYARGIANHWRVHANDVVCKYPSFIMHEIGHNINLHHSGRGTDEYADKSCLMGYSYNEENKPKMCFNGAKTWQLGWFSNYHVDLDPTFSIDWTGDLIGFAEKSSASPTDVMIVRIRSSISQDTYIHFNRQIGFNSEARLSNGGNKLLIATRASYPDFSISNLTAILGNSGVHMIPNFHGSSNALIISVSSILTNTIPARARVNIRFDAVSNAPLASPEPTSFSSIPTTTPTEYPQLFPSETPTIMPTLSPSDGPSTNPTQLPSNVPTANPTPLPSVAPTANPTTLPSDAPTPNPTPFPSNPPTKIPTSNTTKFPSPNSSANATKLPFAKTTLAPTRKMASTRAPTKKKVPTRKPTKNPLPTKNI